MAATLTQFSEHKIGTHYILINDAEQFKPDTGYFVPETLKLKGLVKQMELGRGETVFFSVNDCNYVLRHYRRGGAMASVLRDNYIWLGLAKTRAWCEFKLLGELYDKGFPVPKPVAARVQRKGMFYTADLITEQIESAVSLSTLLNSTELAKEQWYKLGNIIRKFHNANVYHADLNAHNILIKHEKIFLIDFDKCKINKHSEGWKQKNLKRLLRSLNKLTALNKQFVFSMSHWQQLLDGYHNERI